MGDLGCLRLIIEKRSGAEGTAAVRSYLLPINDFMLLWGVYGPPPTFVTKITFCLTPPRPFVMQSDFFLDSPSSHVSANQYFPKLKLHITFKLNPPRPCLVGHNWSLFFEPLMLNFYKILFSVGTRCHY